MEKPANEEMDAMEGDNLLGKMNPMNQMGLFIPDDGSDNTVERKPVRSECCCCLCSCSNELTEGETCMCIFPIKCGVISIGIAVWVLVIIEWFTLFTNMQNMYVPWWYNFVTAILLVPLIIGFCFFIGFYSKDCTRTRGRLPTAVILVLISFLLTQIWEICYFQFIDKNQYIYMGTGDNAETYAKGSKRTSLYWHIAYIAIFATFWSYFIYVVGHYKGLYPPKEEEKPEDAGKAAADKK